MPPKKKNYGPIVDELGRQGWRADEARLSSHA